MGCKNSKAAAQPIQKSAFPQDERQQTVPDAPLVGAAAELPEERTPVTPVERTEPAEGMAAPQVPPLQLSALSQEGAAPADHVVEEVPEQLPVTLQEAEETTVREVVSDGPVKPQPKTLVAKPVNDAAPAEGERRTSLDKEDSSESMGETETLIIESPAVQREEPAAVSSWPLEILGQGFEAMQKRISDAAFGTSATKDQPSHPRSSPRPEEVPLPTLLVGNRFTAAQSDPTGEKKRNYPSERQDLRSCSLQRIFTPRQEGRIVPYEKPARGECSNGMEDVFRSCIGHRDK